MARITGQPANIIAFLDMVALSEIGAGLLLHSDDGYNVIVGGKLFTDYNDHPRILVTIRPGLQSTAAGRYQLLLKYYDIYKEQLKLPDFSPVSQDMIAIQQIKEAGAYATCLAGELALTIKRCAHLWASLPGADYGQHENSFDDLQQVYIAKGGSVINVG